MKKSPAPTPPQAKAPSQASCSDFGTKYDSEIRAVKHVLLLIALGKSAGNLTASIRSTRRYDFGGAVIAFSGFAPVESFDPKSFDAAVSLAQSLTQWGFLIIAGSVLTLVGTSYYRPGHTVIRWSYLLFLVAWFSMGWSIFEGIRVQMANVARLFQSNPDLLEFRRVMTHDANGQITYMEISLCLFGMWLLFFSLWWIFHNEPKTVSRAVAATVSGSETR
jgi:hypothetical protein